MWGKADILNFSSLMKSSELCCAESLICFSAKSRETALESMISAFERRYLFEFVMERHMTLADIVERSLKRGKSREQVLAAKMASLLCVQLGSQCTQVCAQTRPILITVSSDAAVSAEARTAVSLS